jgi:hypothetical protein
MRNPTVVNVVKVEMDVYGDEVETIVDTFTDLDGTTPEMVCLKAKERADELSKGSYDAYDVYFVIMRVD